MVPICKKIKLNLSLSHSQDLQRAHAYQVSLHGAKGMKVIDSPWSHPSIAGSHNQEMTENV